MRDMLGGFPGPRPGFHRGGQRAEAGQGGRGEEHGGQIVSTDELRKSAELRFPGGVTAEVAMARSERFPKSGGRPQVTPATIHEDLRVPRFHRQRHRAFAEQGLAAGC